MANEKIAIDQERVKSYLEELRPRNMTLQNFEKIHNTAENTGNTIETYINMIDEDMKEISTEIDNELAAIEKQIGDKPEAYGPFYDLIRLYKGFAKYHKARKQWSTFRDVLFFTLIEKDKVTLRDARELQLQNSLTNNIKQLIFAYKNQDNQKTKYMKEFLVEVLKQEQEQINKLKDDVHDLRTALVVLQGDKEIIKPREAPEIHQNKIDFDKLEPTEEENEPEEDSEDGIEKEEAKGDDEDSVAKKAARRYQEENDDDDE